MVCDALWRFSGTLPGPLVPVAPGVSEVAADDGATRLLGYQTFAST